jgi:hypothetical protein
MANWEKALIPNFMETSTYSFGQIPPATWPETTGAMGAIPGHLAHDTLEAIYDYPPHTREPNFWQRKGRKTPKIQQVIYWFSPDTQPSFHFQESREPMPRRSSVSDLDSNWKTRPVFDQTDPIPFREAGGPTPIAHRPDLTLNTGCASDVV